MSPRLFAFGLGYTALALARALQADGWQIAGTTRSPEKQARLAAEGIEAHLFARGRPLAEPAAALEDTSHLLTSIAPDEAGVLTQDDDALYWTCPPTNEVWRWTKPAKP